MPYLSASWLREHVAVPADATLEQIAADLVRMGLEEESIDTSGVVTGPLVVGQVLEVTPEPQKNGKVINWCRVNVGPEHNDADGGRGIICGAHNFAAGDHVVVALPGAVLPGDFAISARKTYGHISDGMICSAQELGLGDDHEGIIVLQDPPEVGTDAVELLGLGEPALEINVNPDRGYCFSMRGVAREYSHATGAQFTDPARGEVPEDTGLYGVVISDDAPIFDQPGCDRFVARIVRGINPAAPTPVWMSTRLRQAGMRPISLAVDITNYVMLDLGQPLHAYDVNLLHSPIVVRRATQGEKLTTLDDVERKLHGEDLLITDSPDGHEGTRVLGLAGVMGGADTEVNEHTQDVLIEAAHFDPISVARTARRHKLPSEAAKRFERGVDTQLQAIAAQRAVDLLVTYGGGVADEGATDLNRTTPFDAVELQVGRVGQLIGVNYTHEEVVNSLELIGCQVEQNGETLKVTPPSWRPDLTGPEHLIEEVVRVQGYDAVPSVLPPMAPGGGLTHEQRQRRKVVNFLVDHGLVEVLTYPFIGENRHDELGLDSEDLRRQALKLHNPLAADAPHLRTSLLDTLPNALMRNVARGQTDIALFEVGLVTIGGHQLAASPLPPLALLPPAEVLAELYAGVPRQERHIAGILSGNQGVAGPISEPVPYDYADAIEFAVLLAEHVGVPAQVKQAKYAPFHPGRCAQITLSDHTVLGYAGELAPAVTKALKLPARTVAFELNLDAIVAESSPDPVQIPRLSTFTIAKEDIALVVPEDIPAATVLSVVKEAAGPLAEEVRLFDIYQGQGVQDGWRSLAFALTMRAPDRTLTGEETAAVREAIVAEVSERWGAQLRS